MRLRTLVILGAFLGSAADLRAAITGMRIEASNTQAKLTYNVSDGVTICSLEVSEDPSYSPLVYDLDPAKFEDSNLDNRAGNIFAGAQRVFIVGLRRAEYDAAGLLRSRALQQNTVHYYRLTCGADVLTGQFKTAPIALGNTYNDPIPVDPLARDRGYTSVAGANGWPQYESWAKAARSEVVVDPHTGLAMKRVVMPQDKSSGSLPFAGDHSPKTITGTNWSQAATIWSIDSATLVSIVTGTGSQATVTTSTNHGLGANQAIYISGLATGLNGWHQIASASGTTMTIDRGPLATSTTYNASGLEVTAYAGSTDLASKYLSYSAGTRDWLYLRDDMFTSTIGMDPPLNPMDYITVTVKGLCVGTCAGDDAKITVCLTFNGVNCWPNNTDAVTFDVALTGTLASYTVGTTTATLASWLPPTYAPFNRTDAAIHNGTADVDVSGNVTWKSGAGSGRTSFNPLWVSGSKIVIAGNECTINSAVTAGSLAIDPASCPGLSLPATGAAWTGQNFGLLLRKKTTSTDTIDLQYVKYTTGASDYAGWSSSGSVNPCNLTPQVNPLNGRTGWHCVNVAGEPSLYWIDAENGDAVFLGTLRLNGNNTTDGFSSNKACYGFGVSGTQGVDEHYWCVSSLDAGPLSVFKCGFSPTYSPAAIGTITCNNLTKQSTGRTLNTLLEEFTDGYTPAWNSTEWPCSSAGSQGELLIFVCGRGPQDTIKMMAIFDPTRSAADPGCVGGGNPGCIIAMTNTFSVPGCRWCVLHTQFSSDDPNWVWIAGKYLGSGTSTSIGMGPYVSTITSAALTGTPTIAAGTGVCPVGSLGCDQVTVDGEPCDKSPGGDEATLHPCATNAAWAYLQDAAVGDYFSIDSEHVKLIAKSGNTWTLQRGMITGTLSAHVSLVLNADCSGRDLTRDGIGNWSWGWDFVGDPHSLNADGTHIRVFYDYLHPVPGQNVTIGGAPYYDPKCTTAANGCYGIADGLLIGGTPNKFVTWSPPFLGAIGPCAQGERCQDHASRTQKDSLAPDSRETFNDGRPYNQMIDNSDQAIKVSGATQLFKMTTLAQDKDNLSDPGSNIYVVRIDDTHLQIAGNCSATDPCPVWSDTNNLGSVTAPCTVTLSGGTSGTLWFERSGAGTIRVVKSAALTVAGDTCTTQNGTGYTSGVQTFWSWNVSGGVFAASGTENRSYSNGFIGRLNRKRLPSFGFCGPNPLQDISSPVLGNTITDADNYTMCVARNAGECRTGSSVGDIFLNCPVARKRADGSYGCMPFADSQDPATDMCVGNNGSYINSITQMGFPKPTDWIGAYGRVLTHGFNRWKINDPYYHGSLTPDGQRIMLRAEWLNGGTSTLLTAKVPPFGPFESINRSTAYPMTIGIGPRDGVDNVIVRFGYRENGAASDHYCMPRQEACIASTGTIVESNPYLLAGEGTGGVESGITGLSCSSGCKIVVPAISQRVLYYDIVYRDASNATVAVESRVELIH